MRDDADQAAVPVEEGHRAGVLGDHPARDLADRGLGRGRERPLRHDLGDEPGIGCHAQDVAVADEPPDLAHLDPGSDRHDGARQQRVHEERGS